MKKPTLPLRLGRGSRRHGHSIARTSWKRLITRVRRLQEGPGLHGAIRSMTRRVAQALRSRTPAGGSGPAAGAMPQLTFNVLEIESPVGVVPQRFTVIVTEGLAQFGQTELAFSFRAGQVDVRPVTDRLYGALIVMAQRAQAGSPVAPGVFTAFGPNSPSLIPGTDFRGLLYLPGEIPGLSWPSNVVPTVMVPASDVVLAQNTSFLRVTSRLGQLERYFPVPFWSDPERRPVARDGDETSILTRVSRVGLPDFNTTRTDHGIRMVASKSAGQRLVEVIRAMEMSETPASIGLLSTINPSWKCIMAWEPGQDEPNAICNGPRPSGTEIGLHFAIAVPGQRESSCLLMEDGVGLVLSTTEWRTLMDSIIDGEGRLRLDDGAVIEIVPEWTTADFLHRA